MKTRKGKVPRNHVVVALMQRKAGSGAHGKTEKAQRRQNKMEVKRAACSLKSVEDSGFDDEKSTNTFMPLSNCLRIGLLDKGRALVNLKGFTSILN